jgi:MFS family permease
MIVDRFGTRRFVSVSLALCAFSTILTAISGNITLLVVSRSALGCFASIFMPAVFAVVAAVHERRRAIANAAVDAASKLSGGILTAVIAPAVAAFGWRS